MANTDNSLTKRLGKLSLLIVFVSSSLTGCITAIVAGAAIATIDIIHDRRSAGEYFDDNTIELTAQKFLISDDELRANAHIKPVSWNGILLITGEIDTQSTQQRIVNQLKSIDGVRQLVDETTLSGKSALLARTNDAWISSKVKSRLLLKTGLDANRVKVVTTRGSVYLLGIVTQEEATRATELARTVKGVARVIKVFEYQQAT